MENILKIESPRNFVPLYSLSPSPLEAKHFDGTAPRGGRLHLDLGCARGTFLSAVAALFPSDFFIGVERQAERVARSHKKILLAGLENVAIVHGKMPDILPEIVKEGSVSWVHILFPDPWPKRRHAARRLIQPEFLSLLFKLMRPDGRVRFVTDDEPYWKWTKAIFANDTRWQLLPEDPISNWPKSEFHLRFEALGLPIYGGVFAPML